MQDFGKIRVTWHLAVVVCSLAILPIAVVTLASVIAEPHQRDARAVTRISWGLIAVCLLLSALAIRSRLRQVADPDDRRERRKGIALGLLVIAAAGALTAVLYLADVRIFADSKGFLIPSGAYLVGLTLLGKAMTPVDDAQ